MSVEFIYSKEKRIVLVLCMTFVFHFLISCFSN